MIKKILVAILSILLLFSMVGCSFVDWMPDASVPDNESTIPSDSYTESTGGTTTFPTNVTTEPSETQTLTTTPTTDETIPPQVLTQPEPSDDDFVKVITYIPDITIDLRYSTEITLPINGSTTLQMCGYGMAQSRS